MNKIRNPIAMLAFGTLFGALSGLFMFWHRAGLFSFALTLTVLLARNKIWRWAVFIPGLATGIVLGFFPIYFPDFGIGEREMAPSYDFITLLNCVLFIPLYAYAYSREKWWPRIWRFLLLGCLSALFRAFSLEPLFWHQQVGSNILFGLLPFSVLWLLATWFSDPRYIIDQSSECSP